MLDSLIVIITLFSIFIFIFLLLSAISIEMYPSLKDKGRFFFKTPTIKINKNYDYKEFIYCIRQIKLKNLLKELSISSRKIEVEIKKTKKNKFIAYLLITIGVKPILKLEIDALFDNAMAAYTDACIIRREIMYNLRMIENVYDTLKYNNLSSVLLEIIKDKYENHENQVVKELLNEIFEIGILDKR